MYESKILRWILLTHGHVDHLGGAQAVWEKTGRRAKVVIPKKEARLLRDRQEHIVDYKDTSRKIHHGSGDSGKAYQPC